MKNYSRGYSTNNIRRKNKFPNKLKKLLYNKSNNNINKVGKQYLNKDIYNININNFNIKYNSKKNLERILSIKTIELVSDFKKVLKESEQIKQKIFDTEKVFKSLDIERNTKNKNQKHNKSKKRVTLNNVFKGDLSPITKNKTLDLNITDNSFYHTDFIKNLNNNNNIYAINRNLSNIDSIMNKSQSNFDEDFIRDENKDLKKESKILFNQNILLKERIKQYKLKYNEKKKNNNKNYFDESLNKFINSTKNSLFNNINNNIELSKKIIKIIKDLKILKHNIELKIKKEKIKKKKLIEIKENIKKYYKLSKQKNKLNKEKENLKIKFMKLKSKEKTLSLKYESKLKSVQDKSDLIIKLKYTINNMNQSQDKDNNNISKNKNNKFKNLKLNNGLYLTEINRLKIIINKLEKQKFNLLKENIEIIKNSQNNSNNNNNTIKLKKELEKYQKENEEYKIKINNEEEQINNIKKIINKYTQPLKENKEALNRNKNNINFNFNKKIKTCQSEINNKNGILKIIEDKVKPLYKKNNYLSKTTSFLEKRSIYDKDGKNKELKYENKYDYLFDKIRKKK